MQEERKAQEKRLKEIQVTSLEGLSDDAVLALLAERKHLENILLEYIKADQKQAEAEQVHKKLLAEEEKVEEKIAELNQEISPNKKDEELLALVQERHQLEEELLKIHQELEEPLPLPEPVVEVVPESTPPKEEVPLPAPEPQIVEKVQEKVLPEPEPEIVIQPEVKKESIFKEDTFGEEEIRFDSIQESGDFEKYVHLLESSRESLGSFLQTLPKEARSNKSFMLKVATIDPAYAMHYAADDLRKDESFHIQVASLKNPRNSGNAIAEMDPDMHTGKVILAATRRDFRNVHYVREDMPEYDEIIHVAKKGALEKLSQLKESFSLDSMIPKILQKDEAFMTEMKKVAAEK